MPIILISIVLVLSLSLGASPCVAQNIIPDPTFSHGLPSAWYAPISPDLAWSNGAGADSMPGFAQYRANGPGSPQARICVPITPGATYDSGTTVRLNGTNLSITVAIALFSEAACPSSATLSQTFAPSGPLNFPAGQWSALQGPSVVAPPTARSAEFALVPFLPGGDSIQIAFDNVYLARTGAPSDVPALGAAGTGLLAISVAALSLLLLRRKP